MRYFYALMLCLVLALCPLLGAAEAETGAQTDAYEAILPGARGDAVEKLQFRLAEWGYYEDSLNPPYAYGSMTQAAVKAFQESNGLTSDGIASPETLAALYAESAVAVPVPDLPDVEVTWVRKSDNVITSTFKNNTNEEIVNFKYRLVNYDLKGDVFSSDTSSFVSSTDVMKYYFSEDVSLHPGEKARLRYRYIDIKRVPPVTALGVCEYTTASGKIVALAPDQITYQTSDGKTIAPGSESKEYDTLSQEEYERSRTFALGLNTLVIPQYLSATVMAPEGLGVTVVEPDSLAEKAGIEVGDVIITYNEKPANTRLSIELLKLELLDGKDVVLECRRGNEAYTTTLSLDTARMDELNGVAEETETIADELLKYGELLEKGLITQEEYDQLKSTLLNEHVKTN